MTQNQQNQNSQQNQNQPSSQSINQTNNQMRQHAKYPSALAILSFTGSFIVLAIGLSMSYNNNFNPAKERDITRTLSAKQIADASVIKIKPAENLTIDFDIDITFMPQSEIAINQHIVENKYKKPISIDDADIEIQGEVITISFESITDAINNDMSDGSKHVNYEAYWNMVLPRKDWHITLPEQANYLYKKGRYTGADIVNEGEAINLDIVVNSLNATGNFNTLNIINPYEHKPNYPQTGVNFDRVTIDKLQLFAHDIHLNTGTDDDDNTDEVDIKDIHVYTHPNSALHLDLFDNAGLLNNINFHALTQEQISKLENKDMSLTEQ